MLLTVNALNGAVAITDPNPVEGVLSISLNAGQSWSNEITYAQFQRLLPFLSDLAGRSQKGSGAAKAAPLMSWSVVHSASVDTRGELLGLSALPELFALIGGTISHLGVADLQLKGSALLGGQVKATLLVGVGAGGVLYTAVNPGDPGDLVRVFHLNPGPGGVLAVAVVGTDITVTLGTDGGGVVTSTAAAVAAAVAASAAAAALVVATVPVGGTAQKNLALTNLGGGKGEGMSVKVNGQNCSLISTSDTVLHVTVPAIVGAAAGDEVRVRVRSGIPIDMTVALT